MNDVLRVNGQTFDPEDLTFGEKREIRRLIRNEIWKENLDGPFDWEEVGENEVFPATICVFMRRENEAYTVREAMTVKPRDAYGTDDDPPTLRPVSDPVMESEPAGTTP